MDVLAVENFATTEAATESTMKRVLEIFMIECRASMCADST